jgi:hypothetical protein
MQQIKVSYTILNAWEQGRYEDAIKYLFKLGVIQTPAMKAGQDFHKSWENEIAKTKKLPEVFGSKKLINPSPEQYLQAQINDWLTLSGKIDCYDKPTIYEFKTGKQTSEDVIRSKQPGVYAVLATLNKLYADRAEIYCYNQYVKKDNKTMSIIYLTNKVLEDALNWVETLARDLLNYCIQNNLFNKYSQNLNTTISNSLAGNKASNQVPI